MSIKMLKFTLIMFLQIFSVHILIAQSATEIYVFDLIKTDSGYHLKNPENISMQNVGYDNQPHFLNNETLLYASTKDDQTDIVKIELGENSWEWLTKTEGNEYSPTPTPDSAGFSSILLEKNGTQLLWKYYFDQQDPEVLVPNLKIGYHCWFNDSTIIAFVLGDPHTLQICKLNKNKNIVIGKNIGRSLHKIPGTKQISFISKETEKWRIIALDPVSGIHKVITETLPGSEDLAWSPDGVVFMGSEDTLYKYNPLTDKKWKKVVSLKEFDLSGITRLAISSDGKKIAVVVNE